jgi:hypothetical protein
VNQAINGAMPLLTEADFRALLGGMSERKFQQLRAAGIVGAPLELGPRVARWTHADYLETVARLPRREKAPEPETLGAARRARIEAMKRKTVEA